MFAVYILTSTSNSVLYVGVTSRLKERVWQHKQHVTSGFTDKYNVEKLVYYEVFDDISSAIKREKQLKKWRRSWKNELITGFNRYWVDLYDDI
ncbi:TPA: GIY-YIG nuclease family protein [Photobacterium damselae]|uniref:GIY-YIG nuclease family protein n=1 Tax=Photobacterium damselae TaxID=38293 RepID=UPI0015946A84|nr:GIY-YIG nuclease family protein [Photobacterium damselae subsp. damselae]